MASNTHPHSLQLGRVSTPSQFQHCRKWKQKAGATSLPSSEDWGQEKVLLSPETRGDCTSKGQMCGQLSPKWTTQPRP